MSQHQKETIQIRTYTFKRGILHLERAATRNMPDKEVAEMYAEQGPLLRVEDGEMVTEDFFGLPDLRDL